MKFQEFVNCVSLGCNCEVAGSLGLNLLRSSSGPFDWCVSDFASIIHVLENGFSDFMHRENPEVMKENPKVFVDKKLGFVFFHDVKEDFQREFQQIKVKYNRRASRLLDTLKLPTCFFRMVKDNDEIKYINDNRIYIESVIKQGNINNELVFFLIAE